MEHKGCKRFATTTEAEIVEKHLKLNAERTIKQNKAAPAILKDCLFQKKMDRVLIWWNYLTISPKLHSVHIQNSAQCHQVFNNCSVTIVMPKT